MRHIGARISIIVAAGLAMAYYRWGDDKVQAPELGVIAPLPPSEAKREIHAREFVQFTKGGFARVRKQDLVTLLQLTQDEKVDKAKAMVAQDGNSDAPCAWLSPQRRYHVLSTSYGDTSDKLGLLEVAAEGVQTQRGAWALSVGAVPVAAADATPATP